MDGSTGFPDYSGNACAILSPDDRERLWQAACTLVDERGLIVRITSLVGQGTEWAGGKASELGAKVFGEGWEDKIKEYAEEALWRAHDVATFGMDPDGDREPWSWFNKAIASATGAAGGFFGLPGMAIDIPISTLMIMRSIAEIARAHGENIGSDDGKRACLEVMAFGGPGVEDDDAEVGYWSTRALFAHTAIEIAVKQAAARFSVVLSEKALAQIVPVAGAFAGGGLNYVFMDFYQQMARVHFSIRSIERGYGEDGAIRACFDQLVRQARERRRIRKPEARGSEP
jgi:hypothetical protein